MLLQSKFFENYLYVNSLNKYLVNENMPIPQLRKF